MRRLVEGLMPVKVSGEIEWTLNQLDNNAYALTLLNNRGVIKPQHGILPTDHAEAQKITITTSAKSATEWITNTTLEVKPDGLIVTVPAGGVRIIQFR